jgi:hypothetical protein
MRQEIMNELAGWLGGSASGRGQRALDLIYAAAADICRTNGDDLLVDRASEATKIAHKEELTRLRKKSHRLLRRVHDHLQK